MLTNEPRDNEDFQLLKIKEADAWFVYRDEIQDLPTASERYIEVEAKSWAKLERKRQEINRRRASLQTVK